MANVPDLDVKIWEIKNKIADTRDYISSDYCNNCARMYKQLDELENQLKELENERNRQS